MLFQAEDRLHKLSKKQAPTINEKEQKRINELEDLAKFEQEESKAMRKILEQMQVKYKTAVEERERYLEQLLTIKMSQAEMLDESNRIVEESNRKVHLMEE